MGSTTQTIGTATMEPGPAGVAQEVFCTSPSRMPGMQRVLAKSDFHDADAASCGVNGGGGANGESVQYPIGCCELTSRSPCHFYSCLDRASGCSIAHERTIPSTRRWITRAQEGMKEGAGLFSLRCSICHEPKYQS